MLVRHAPSHAVDHLIATRVLLAANMCRKFVVDELIRAARRVSKSVNGPDKKKTESDLLKMLKAHEVDVEAARTGQPLQSLDLA